MPPDQKQPFIDVDQMISSQYEGFGYTDWLDEVNNEVTKMLPTGL
jgi:hypothetical protein